MSIVLAFSKLCVSSAIKTIQKCSQQQFHMTPALCGEPLKKKKRIDPQIIKNRIDRRKRKIEREIRRLKKNARQLKPIDEVELPKNLTEPKDRSIRARPVIQLSADETERRALLQKDWARYQNKQKLEIRAICRNVIKSQRIALNELRMESEELYLAAIQPDTNLLPVTFKGPVATPPIKNYDGDYNEISKKWE